MHENFNHSVQSGIEQEKDTKNLALKMREQIPTPTDYAENLFLDLAVEQGLLVIEPEMIKLERVKQRKGDKLSTVPDFLVKQKLDDDGIYILR